jgi:hypothetical protein
LDVYRLWANAAMGMSLGSISLGSRVAGAYGASASSAAKLEYCKAARHLIESFSGLENNWDGYGGLAISESARSVARNFIDIIAATPTNLPEPEVAPTSAGTISIEWETDRAEAYIEIGNTKFSGFVKTEGQEPLYLEGRLNELDQRAIALIQDAILPPVMSSEPISQIRFDEAVYAQLAA